MIHCKAHGDVIKERQEQTQSRTGYKCVTDQQPYNSLNDIPYTWNHTMAHFVVDQ